MMCILSPLRWRLPILMFRDAPVKGMRALCQLVQLWQLRCARAVRSRMG